MAGELLLVPGIKTTSAASASHMESYKKNEKEKKEEGRDLAMDDTPLAACQLATHVLRHLVRLNQRLGFIASEASARVQPHSG